MLGRYSFDLDESDEGTLSSLPRKPPSLASVSAPVASVSASTWRQTSAPRPSAQRRAATVPFSLNFAPFSLKFVRRSAPAKSAWVVALVLCWAASGFHCWRLLSAFSSGRSVFARGAARPFSFPDVTVCPPSAFFRRDVGKVDTFGASNKSFGFDILLQSAPALWRYVLYRNMSFAHLSQTQREYATRLSLLSIHRHFINSSAAITPLDAVAYCRYQGQLCSMSDFVPFYHPAFGACFTFRPRSRRLRSSYFDIDKPGLVLQLHTLEPSDWLLTADSRSLMTHRHSFSVTLHPALTWPTFDEVAHVSSGRITTLRARMLQRWRTSLDDDASVTHSLSRVSASADFCFGGHRCRRFRSRAADRLLLLRQRELADDCGCVSDSLPIPRSLAQLDGCVAVRDPLLLLFDPAKVRQLDAYVYISDEAGKLRWIEDTRQFATFRRQAACFLKKFPKPLPPRRLRHLQPDAVETQYAASVDSGPWFRSSDTLQAGYIARNLRRFERRVARREAARLNRSLPVQQYLRRMKEFERSIHANHVLQKMTGMLEVRPAAFTSRQLQEVWLYPLSAFVADVGGALGLLLGASVVSLLESLDAVLLLLCSRGRQPAACDSAAAAAAACRRRRCPRCESAAA